MALAACEDVPEYDTEAAISAALHDAALGSQKGNDYSAAAAHFRQLYERDRNDAGALLGLARNLRYAGQPREAVKILKLGIKDKNKETDLVLEMGKSQLAASFINDARETVEEVVAKAPERWDSHAVAGIIYDRLGNYDKALVAYRQALDLSPGNVAVLNNMALSLAQAGQLDGGVTVLEKVVNSEKSTAQTRQNLALLYALKGDFARAERLALEDLPADSVRENMETYRRLRP